MNDPEPVYSVSEITGAVKRTLESGYGRIRVRGEISNHRLPSSGHHYFGLKDERAQLRAVMFRGNAAGLRFLPADGVEVEADGEISVYEPRGDLQLLVRQMVPSGLGALMQAFEALKSRLAEEGLFATERKRPIPRFPRTIGIVTSPTGAAIRDLTHVLGRRWPIAEIVLHPVRVQGEGAGSEIARAVERMNRREEIDVLIVGRGGGSLEDLWAFNEEVVARAIFASRIPVVSAVGHEIDTTIADLVSDLRAATPSAAAEIVSPDRREVASRLLEFQRRLSGLLEDGITSRRSLVNRLAGAYGFRQPKLFLRREAQRLDDLAGRLGIVLSRRMGDTRRRWQETTRRLGAQHPRVRVAAARTEVDARRSRLAHGIRVVLQSRRDRTHGMDRALRALGPVSVLSRGYCLARDPGTGKIVRSAGGLAGGAPLLVEFLESRAHTRVERTERGGPPEIDGGGSER